MIQFVWFSPWMHLWRRKEEPPALFYPPPSVSVHLFTRFPPNYSDLKGSVLKIQYFHPTTPDLCTALQLFWSSKRPGTCPTSSLSLSELTHLSTGHTAKALRKEKEYQERLEGGRRRIAALNQAGRGLRSVAAFAVGLLGRSLTRSSEKPRCFFPAHEFFD